MKPKAVEIHINWLDEKSISRAEVTKAKLENDCYALVDQSGGLDSSILIYRETT